MSNFSSVLEEFVRGDCTITEVETRIERDIALGVVPANELLDILDNSQQATLDSSVRASLEKCIWAAETRRRTQLSAQSENSDRTRIAFPPDSATATTAPQGPERRTVEVGDTLKDRFVLEEQIGSGGMSQVFRAIDKRKLEARSRDPHVALKVMNVAGADPGEAFVAMQREAQKSQLLNHPNILRVNDFDRDGGVVYTTMEMLSGQALHQYVAKHGNPGLRPDIAVSFINSMAEALAYAHDNKIVHADFKPGNVFVTDKDEIKVIDFGIARAIQPVDAPEEDKTVFDPRVLGALTPAYASPEMLENGETDARDDIYALGCVAYELFTGKHPYSRLKATDARDNDHPLKTPETASKEQWHAIRHALEFDRNARTPNVRTFMDELNAEPASSVGRLVKPAAGLMVIAVAAVAGWWWWSQPPGVGVDPIDAPVTTTVPGAGRTGSSPGAVIRDCDHCPAVMSVPPGAFTMGVSAAPASGVFEYPAHKVTLAGDFALGLREVTVGEFRAFVDAEGGDFSGCRTVDAQWLPEAARSWRSPGFPQSERHPVTCVSWQDANAYTEWLSRETGEAYRLPSEAEWEYVATTQAGLDLTADDTSVCNEANVADASLLSRFDRMDVAHCRDGHVFTAPVDRGAQDQFTDLRGNVFEWTSDCWSPSYAGAPIDGSARADGACSERVLRGGSWFTAPTQQRVTYRNRFDESYRSNTFGFRVVRDADG